MKAKTPTVLLLAVLVVSALSTPARARNSTTLTVFAASSLTDAFQEIATGFTSAHADVEVAFNFGASSTLATQLLEGAPADVFASANNKQMDVVREGKRIAGVPLTFAQNRLVLAVPADNPARIASLRDLARPGIKLVVAAPNVPVREYTNTMLDRLAKEPDYGEAYRAAVLKNIVSEEDNVRQVSLKVSLGEADAGIVYLSDITPDMAAKILTLPIPDAYNTLATYPITVTSASANPDLAQVFIDYVLSDAGQDILVKWGFIPVHTPEPIITFSADGVPVIGK